MVRWMRKKRFQIEDDLILLDLKNFDIIQDYVNKANELRALLKDCGNLLKDGRLIYHILKRLPLEYASFFLSYKTHRLTMGVYAECGPQASHTHTSTWSLFEDSSQIEH